VTSATWPKAVAHRIGLGGEVLFTNARCGVTLHLPCRGWGKHAPHTVDVKIPPGQNPEAVARKLLAQGWRIGHRLVCPDSRKKKEKQMPPSETRMAAMASTADPALAAGMSSPSPAAGRARRLVYLALEDYYDEVKRGYKPPHSDASIAKECGVAEQLVKSIREESYGPLAVPGELAEVKREIAGLEQRCKDVQSDATSRLATIARDVGTLATRLESICKKNGWAS
jgi:hypothetical protein